MELITTERGGAMLLHDGHSYTRIKSNESTLYWACRQRTLCKTKVVTDLAITRILSYSSDHTHAGDPTELSVLRVRHEMKLRAGKLRKVAFIFPVSHNKNQFLYVLFACSGRTPSTTPDTFGRSLLRNGRHCLADSCCIHTTAHGSETEAACEFRVQCTILQGRHSNARRV